MGKPKYQITAERFANGQRLSISKESSSITIDWKSVKTLVERDLVVFVGYDNKGRVMLASSLPIGEKETFTQLCLNLDKEHNPVTIAAIADLLEEVGDERAIAFRWLVNKPYQFVNANGCRLGAKLSKMSRSTRYLHAASRMCYEHQTNIGEGILWADSE